MPLMYCFASQDLQVVPFILLEACFVTVLVLIFQGLFCQGCYKSTVE